MSQKPRASVLFLFAKIGSKVLLPLLKSAKFAKFGLAGLSLASYTYLYTWQFAIFIMASLFLHEIGHAIAMRLTGMSVKGIYFIPFLGGAAVSESAFTSRKQESIVALAGPLFGLTVSLLCALLYLITHDGFWGAAAAWNAAINLFNLLPIFPLDGGRVMRSCAFSIHSRLGFFLLALSVVATIVLAVVAHSGLFLLLSIVGGIELASEVWEKNKKVDTTELPTDSENETQPTEELATPVEIPAMRWHEILLSLFAAFALAFVCFFCLHIFSDIPEVQVARHLFIDKP